MLFLALDFVLFFFRSASCAFGRMSSDSEEIVEADLSLLETLSGVFNALKEVKKSLKLVNTVVENVATDLEQTQVRLDAQQKCIEACKLHLVRRGQEKDLAEPMLKKRKYVKTVRRGVRRRNGNE